MPVSSGRTTVPHLLLPQSQAVQAVEGAVGLLFLFVFCLALERAKGSNCFLYILSTNYILYTVYYILHTIY